MAAVSRVGVFVIVIVLVAAFSAWTECTIVHSRTRIRTRRSRVERTANPRNLELCLMGLINRTNCTSNDLSSLSLGGGDDDGDDDNEGPQYSLLLFMETSADSGEYTLNANQLLTDVCASGRCQQRDDLFCRFDLLDYVANPAGRRLKLEVHFAGQRQLVCGVPALSSNDSMMITEQPFLSRWSMVGNSFDTCGLILTGCFPPCCGGNSSTFSMSLHTGSGLNYSITYSTSIVNCSKLFVPYQTELQTAMYHDRGGLFQAEVTILLPGSSGQFVANITHNNASDLLCKTQCSNVLRLPEELRSLLNTVEFCYNLDFIASIPNTTLLVPDSATASLGGVACETSTVQTDNSLVIDNCMAGPYASVQELHISTSTFSPICPEDSQTKIVNYTLKINEGCTCGVNNLNGCIRLCTSEMTNYADVNVLHLCEQVVYLLINGSSIEGDDVDTVIDILISYAGHMESNATLESAVKIISRLVPGLEEVYNRVLFVGDNRTQELLRVTDSLLSERGLWESANQSTAAGLLNNLELFGAIVTTALANSSTHNMFNYYGQYFSMAIDQVSSSPISGYYTFPPTVQRNVTTSIHIPTATLCGGPESSRCQSFVVSFTADNFHLFLTDSGLNRRVASSLLSSQIILPVSEVVADNVVTYNNTMGRPIQLTFHVASEGKTNYSCVFWDYTLNNGRGGWSTDGVMFVSMNRSTVSCYSSHLTSFAVLVTVSNETQFTPEERIALLYITYIGCGISIVFLLLTIVILLACKKQLNKGPLLYVHLNLCIALVLALLLFVSGIETALPIRWLCGVVAGLLHYLFLSVFCWMLAEGIMLYLLVVRVFGTAAEKWYLLLPVGWGLPLLIVAISAAVRYDSYGTDSVCWLSLENGLIWAFVAPLLAITVVNFVMLLLTLKELTIGRKRHSPHLKQWHLLWNVIKSTLVLLPLLGLTWVLGLFAINSNTTLFAWLFTVCNSLQGMFIFVFHVLRNDKVRSWLKSKLPRCTYKHMKRKQSSLSSSSSPITMDLELEISMLSKYQLSREHQS